MNKNKTIQSVAQEIYDNMTYSERVNGEKYCHLKEDIEWQKEIIFNAHLDRMPNDDIYDRINTILSVILDCNEETAIDEIRNIIYEIEPDCYTSNLTAWLNSDNRNVYYLGDALGMGFNDGFQLLAYAQSCYIQEIGNALLDAIQEYIDEEG